MRAAVILEQGGTPKVVQFEDPQPREGAVIIKVDVGAVGPTDLFKAAGTYRPYPGPHVVNGEGAGTTPDGSRVYFGHSIVPYGSWAEKTLVSEDEVWPIPPEVDNAQAAAIGVSGTGALIALEQAAIVPGDRVLVLGATGVLGQLGLQIARDLGAGLLVAASRNPVALKRLRDRGLADDTVQIGQGDDVGALRNASQGGWDVVLDIVFGEPGAAALKTAAKGARIMCVSRMASPTMMVDLVDLGFKTMSSVGTGIRPPLERRKAFERLMALAVRGKLSIDVTRYSLDRAPEAWGALINSPYSKIVIAQ
jgi:NADPH2:quinone reductase